MIEANWLLIDTCLRGGAGTLFLLGAIMLFRAPKSYASRLGMVLMLSAAGFAIDGVPAVAGIVTLDWFMKFCAALVIPMFWLFARAWFDDDYRPSGLDAAIVVAFVAAGMLQGPRREAVGWHSAIDLIIYGLGTVLAAHALWLAWRDRGTDLVEARNRVRMLFVLTAGLAIVWALWGEAASRFGPSLPWLSLANAVALCALGLGLDSALFGLEHPETFPDPQARRLEQQRQLQRQEERPEQELDLLDPVLEARLDQMMSHERLYRDPDLTIGQLAVRLGMAEHRLRRLINGGLGFRNFNEYLNGHRIEEVRAALADQAQNPVPILTIAMDAGFGSLPAFNRAFKAVTGETPSEFRRRAQRAE